MPTAPRAPTRRRTARSLRIVSACINAAGRPDFALSTVPAALADTDPGGLYDALEEGLRRRGYECPFVHFSELEAPPFLIPALQHYLRLPD